MFFCFGAIFLFTTSGCLVKTYYSTAQVDESFRVNCNQALNSLSNLENQLNKLEMKYHEIQCDNKTANLKKSDSMLLQLEAEMNEIQQLKGKINQEYQNFQNYTRGKDKIVSGSPEHKALKITRSTLKSTIALLQEKGDLMVKNAEAFTNFTTHNVVPEIRVCVVADFKSQIQNAIQQLNQSQQQLQSQNNQYQKDVTDYTALHQAKKPEKIIALKNVLQQLNEADKEISAVLISMKSIYDAFDQATLGNVTVNSCSRYWEHVTQAESNLKIEQSKFDLIQSKIQKTVDQLQGHLK